MKKRKVLIKSVYFQRSIERRDENFLLFFFFLQTNNRILNIELIFKCERENSRKRYRTEKYIWIIIITKVHIRVF